MADVDVLFDLEKVLRPLRTLLPLLPLRMLEVSEGAAILVPVAFSRVVLTRGAGARETGSKAKGGTSQCARKCSPRTELYGLQTFPCC